MLDIQKKGAKIGDKLHHYFENTGVQKKWLSVRMGLDPHFFYQILRGDRYLPQKYWKALITLTNGKITLQDLIEDCLREFDGIEIQGIDGKLACEISLKEINNQEQQNVVN